MVISYSSERKLIHMSNITGHLTDMQLVWRLVLMSMTLTCLSEMLLLEVNMFGTVMTHHIIRMRMRLVELLVREHNLHVSNTEFKEIFF